MTLNLGVSFRALGLAACALLLTGAARAECGKAQYAKPTSLHLQAAAPRLLLAALPSDEAEGNQVSIVGFWHVKFISKGSSGIPDGTEVDAGYAQWHSDGTEIMNSAGRSPTTNAFCLGVWRQIGPRQFQLNHFASAYDSSGTQLIGPGNIRENVTLGPEGKRFEGTFTIDQYTEAGNLVAHVQGKVVGTRIEVDTLPSKIF